MPIISKLAILGNFQIGFGFYEYMSFVANPFIIWKTAALV